MSLWNDLYSVGEAVYDWGAEALDDVVDFFGYDPIDSTGISAMEYAAYAEEGLEAGSLTASFLDDIGVSGAWDYVSDTFTEAYDWIGGSDALSAAAGKAATSLFGKDGQPTFKSPTAKKMSGSARSAGSAGSFKASAADLGFTPKVQKAMQSAINANKGYGSLEQAIAMLRSRRSQGPFLQLESPQIRVKSRAKQVG